MMAQQDSQQTIHASCVAIDGRAVLLMGPSGAGKSDLALRLIDRGASLVSDHYTGLAPSPHGELIANAPATIAGMIEVRGLGIVSFPCVSHMPVALAVELTGEVERLPQTPLTAQVAGVVLPLMKVAPFEASAPIKVELMLRQLSARSNGHAA